MTIGILTKANQSNVENTHGTVKEAISLAYNEYQIQIKTSSSEKIEETTKIASTEMVRIQGEETKETASGTETSFWEFLVGKRYIDGTTGIVDTKELTGQTLSLGNGSGNSDVYKIEEASEGYVLKYYDEGENSEILWQTNNSTNSGLSETELKEKLQQVEGDAFIDSNGNIFDTDKYETLVTDENSFSLTGQSWEGEYGTEYENGYFGEFIEGKLEYDIPAFLKQGDKIYKLTEISDYVFKSCRDLISVTIPEGVITIGNGAFYNCSGLTNITIPSSVTNIGDSAFHNCDSLITMKIPNGVTSIGESAFYSCESLKNINIPDGVTIITSSVFQNCSDLSNIIIPKNVTSIGYSAFGDCNSLETITIPEGVTTIGIGAFRRCTNLAQIKLPDSLTTIEGDAFESCTSLLAVNIPKNVTEIGGGAFGLCSSLEKIELPEGITKIFSETFIGCTKLTTINIPESVTSIGRVAFSRCDNLTEINIPESVTSISDEAFANSGIISITVNKPKNSIADAPWGADNATVTWTDGITE